MSDRDISMLLDDRHAYEQAKMLTALLADWLLVKTSNVIDDATIQAKMTEWQSAKIRAAAEDLAVAVAARGNEEAQHAMEQVLRFSRDLDLEEIHTSITNACGLSRRFAPSMRNDAISELCAKYGRHLSIAVALLEQAGGRDELSDAEIGVVVAGKVYAWFDHGFAMEIRDAIDRLTSGAPREFLPQVITFGEQLMHWAAEPASLLVIPLLQVRAPLSERRTRPFSSFEVAIIDDAKIRAWYAQRDQLIASAKHLERLVKARSGPSRADASINRLPGADERDQRGDSLH
jgi:hypothetical protein